MPFTVKDVTANVYVLYIDNNGRMGLMGSANSDQALAFAGVGVITSGAYMANGIASAGSPSALTGTIVIPANSSAIVGYSVPQIPAVNADSTPTNVTTSGATFQNKVSNPATLNYNIW